MSLDQALVNFEKSLNRLAAAIEALSALEKKATTIEVPHTEKKPPAAKAKKSETAVAAPVSSPVSAPPTPPAPPPAAGPATVSPSPVPATPKDEDEDFLDAPAAASPKAFTVEEVRAEAIALRDIKGEPWVKEIIATVGNAKKISDIDPAKFPSVMAAFARGR